MASARRRGIGQNASPAGSFEIAATEIVISIAGSTRRRRAGKRASSGTRYADLRAPSALNADEEIF